MCIAVYKKQGVEMPKKATLKVCFKQNPDGAGFMYAKDGKVHIRKGFMSFNAFYKALSKVENLKDTPVVMHFRISTQGGVQKELTHPFALSNNYDTMRQLSGVYDYGVAHNGIISLTSKSYVKDHNDTMEFIKEILYPTIKSNKKWYENKHTKSIIDYLLGTNKIVVLKGDGTATIIGHWVEDNGVLYSNDSYIDRPKVSYWTSTSKYLKNYTPIIEPSGDRVSLNEKQKDELLKHGVAFCEKCGGEMWVECSYDTDDVYLYCLDCGEYLLLDKKSTEFVIDNGLAYAYDSYDDDYYERLAFGL